MVLDRREWLFDPRTFGTGSIAEVAIGLAFIVVGEPALTTVGVVAVIFGVVSLLLAVGVYLADSGPFE